MVPKNPFLSLPESTNAARSQFVGNSTTNWDRILHSGGNKIEKCIWRLYKYLTTILQNWSSRVETNSYSWIQGILCFHKFISPLKVSTISMVPRKYPTARTIQKLLPSQSQGTSTSHPRLLSPAAKDPAGSFQHPALGRATKPFEFPKYPTLYYSSTSDFLLQNVK